MVVPDDKWRGLMIDFESLDTEPTSILLSGAFVVFTKEDVLYEHYAEFDIVPQSQHGRTISKKTVAWWDRTNAAEMKRLVKDGKCSVSDFILHMRETMRDHQVTSVWSRHHYDLDVVKNILGLLPWPFYYERDVATLDEFGVMDKENSHNALEDCLNQIKFVQEVLPKENK